VTRDLLVVVADDGDIAGNRQASLLQELVAAD